MPQSSPDQLSSRLPRMFVLDNYDSFTFNLVQALGELGCEISVARSDKVGLDDIHDYQPDGIIVSPGPGPPATAGISKAAIQHFGRSLPVLGVCLGHQCIGEVFGARVGSAKQVVHGKTSQVFHDSTGVFDGLSNPFEATRYHSLAIDPATMPDDLQVTATSEDGTIMGLRHRTLATYGVQFHPESVLTTEGTRLIKNFVDLVAASGPEQGS